jgi:hypothetical protein
MAEAMRQAHKPVEYIPNHGDTHCLLEEKDEVALLKQAGARE